MTERTPLPFPHAEHMLDKRDMSHRLTGKQDWGRDRLSEALDSRPAHTHDVGWGDGTVYSVGADPATAGRLEVFPEAGVVRVTGQDTQITIFRQPPPALYADRVRFEQQRPDGQLELTITRHGRLRLELIPALADPAPEPASPHAAPLLPVHLPHDTPSTDVSGGAEPVESSPATAENGPEGPNGPVWASTGPSVAPATETAVSDDSGGAAGDANRPSVTPEHGPDDGSESKSERLNLAGRLGRPPAFRTTRIGTLIASFPLAVREDDGSTTWHTVLAFGDRAEKLREGLAKGQQIEVIGYLHQRERTLRSGETRTIAEVYATVVKPR